MEIYIIKNYCWYNEDTDQIQDDHRIPHLELTKTRKEVKKIAEEYGGKIMKWEKRSSLHEICREFTAIRHPLSILHTAAVDQFFTVDFPARRRINRIYLVPVFKDSAEAALAHHWREDAD